MHALLNGVILSVLEWPCVTARFQRHEAMRDLSITAKLLVRLSHQTAAVVNSLRSSAAVDNADGLSSFITALDGVIVPVADGNENYNSMD